MNTHTPGPWAFRYGGSDNCPLEVYVPIENGDTIAGEYGISEEANARLIASAPDLLEALEALVKSHAPDANFPAVNNARSAIAKARGK